MKETVKSKILNLRNQTRAKEKEFMDSHPKYEKYSKVIRNKKGHISIERIATGFLLFIVILVTPAACKQNEKDEVVDIVKASVLPQYSEELTMKEAFNNPKFKYGSWQYLKKDKKTGNHFVQYSFELYEDEDSGEEPVNVDVIFSVSKDKKAFALTNCYANNVEDNFLTLMILATAFETEDSEDALFAEGQEWFVDKYNTEFLIDETGTYTDYEGIKHTVNLDECYIDDAKRIFSPEIEKDDSLFEYDEELELYKKKNDNSGKTYTKGLHGFYFEMQ